jgi:hypothetical protein
MPPTRSRLLLVPRSQSVPPCCPASDIMQVLPLLSSQTELLYQSYSHVIVTAEEQMSQSATKTEPRTITSVANMSVLPEPRARTPSCMPIHTTRQTMPQPSKAVSFACSRSPDDEQLRGSSHSRSPSLSSLSSLEEPKISKPPGEVGHPGRGGYTLEEKLSWTDDKFKAVKVSVSEIYKYLLTENHRGLSTTQ